MVSLHSQAAERKAYVRFCNTYSAAKEISFAWCGENDSTRFWIVYSSGLYISKIFWQKEYSLYETCKPEVANAAICKSSLIPSLCQLGSFCTHQKVLVVISNTSVSWLHRCYQDSVLRILIKTCLAAVQIGVVTEQQQAVTSSFYCFQNDRYNKTYIAV